MKSFNLIGFFLFSVICSFMSNAEDIKPTQTAEAFVKEFYDWYMQNDTPEHLPEELPLITQYVDEATVKYILSLYRSGLPSANSEYFMKVSQYDKTKWQQTMQIYRGTQLADLTIVPVSFGDDPKINIILYLKPQGDSWRIIKAADSRPYP